LRLLNIDPSLKRHGALLTRGGVEIAFTSGVELITIV
jgi:hypothetical protein